MAITREFPWQYQGISFGKTRDFYLTEYMVGMDGANLRNIRRICGDDPEGKISLLLDWTGRPGEVADPWYTGDFDAAWRDVLEGCSGLLAHIQGEK